MILITLITHFNISVILIILLIYQLVKPIRFKIINHINIFFKANEFVLNINFLKILNEKIYCYRLVMIFLEM